MKQSLLKKALSFLTIVFILIFSSSSFAQYIAVGSKKFRTEVGFNLGPTFFLGDLGGNKGIGTKFVKDINPEVTRIMKGLFVNIYPSKSFGFRFGTQLTYVAGSDNLISTNGRAELMRKQRNLDFRSKIIEGYGAIEFFPTLMFKNNFDDDKTRRLFPYFFAGVGIFHFDPEGSMVDRNGKRTWHKLHELRTEGQGMAEYPDRKPYKLTQINLPLGFGIKMISNDRITTSLECLYRHTFTDYIDDVSTSYIDPNMFDRYLSQEQADLARQIHDKAVGIVTPGLNRFRPGDQRGNPKNTDTYFSFLFKVGVNLGNSDEGGGGYRYSSKRSRNAMRCPVGVF